MSDNNAGLINDRRLRNTGSSHYIASPVPTGITARYRDTRYTPAEYQYRIPIIRLTRAHIGIPFRAIIITNAAVVERSWLLAKLRVLLN